MTGFTDIHQHVAYGLDDGPASIAETKRLLAADSKDGIRLIIATPHVEPGYVPFDFDAYLRQIDKLNRLCAEQSLAIELFPGAEIFYTDSTLRLLQDHQVPTLAGSAFVLVEFEPAVTYDRIFEAVHKLANDGYIPVIAHVERYACLVKKVARAYELKDMFNMRLQMNCNTVVKRQGMRLRGFINKLLSDRMIDYVATDAHNTSSRPPAMRMCYQTLFEQYGQAYALAVTRLNQREILAIDS